MMRLGYLALVLTALAGSAWAQNSTSTVVTTVPVSTVTRTVSRASASASISLSTVFSVHTIVTSFPTATASPVSDSTQNALNTRIGPAFGVLGGLLILTGLPSAFWGHKNRWSSFFIVGFYALAIVCMSLIIRFGVLEAVDPPSETLRGLFVLSSVVAGIIGGGFAIFFWKGTKYFIGALGGFAVGLFIQALHDDGLIEPLGFRYFLYLGCAVIGFVLCTLPKLHYQILLAATAVVGASAFILGVDCFTRAGLKEFYVYNLGFKDLFPQFADIPFRVTQTMQIELGMMGAVAIMGMAVQARVLIALQARLREINAEQERRNAEVEARAALQFSRRDEELAQWELEHGAGAKNRYSSRPDDLEASRTLTPDTRRASSQFSIFKGGSKEKGRSSLTMADLSTTPPAKEERPTTPALTLDFGEPAGQKFAESLLTPGAVQPKQAEDADPNVNGNTELLSEIRGIREAINAIKQERPTSLFGTNALETTKLADGRPSSFSKRPRGASVGTPLDSMNTVGTGLRNNTGNSPTQRGYSTPMSNEWDDYVKSRSLFQPPSGVTQPVTPTRVEPRPHSISVPQAVTQAVEQRQRQEKAYVEGGPQAYLEVGGSGSRPGSALFGSFFNGATKSGDSLPLADRRRTHSDSRSLAQARPGSQVYILPPKPSPTHAPDQPVVKTFEELSARHKEKIKALQDPLSRQTTEEAQVAAARNRWERSLATEKTVMSKKEQEATRKEQTRRGSDVRLSSHIRSSSAFALHSGVEAPRRPTSTAKVQDWQRHQDATQQQQRSLQVDVRAPGRSSSKSPLPLSGGR